MKEFYTPSGKKVERVGIYCRVSGEGQADNTSLENQGDKCRDFANEHNLDIITEKEEIITGKSRWGARQAYTVLLDMGKRGLIDAILVDKSDRLGRGRALSTLIDRAEQSGLTVLVAKKKGPLTDQEIHVDGLVSGAERENIGERTREGKLKTALAGKVVFSKSPYGMRLNKTYDPETGEKVDTKIEFVEDEVKAIRNMFRWLVVDQETIRGIQRNLYRGKVLPPGLTRKMTTQYDTTDWDAVPEKWEKSKLWSTATIRRTLGNETYIGRWWYNKRVTKRIEKGDHIHQVVTGERPRDEQICLEIQPIVTESLFREAQEILNRNKARAGKPPQHKYLLRSIFHCSCGRSFIINGNTGQYRCTGNQRPIKKLKCGSPYLSQERVEYLVWLYVESALLDPERLLQEYEQKQEAAKLKNVVLLEQIEVSKGSIRKGEVRLKNLIDLRLDLGITQKTYQNKKVEIETGIKSDRADLARAQAQLTQELGEDDKAAFLDFCKEMWQQLGSGDPTLEQKRKALLRLDVHVTYLKDHDALRIEGLFPTTEMPYENTLPPLEPNCSNHDGDGPPFVFPGLQVENGDF